MTKAQLYLLDDQLAGSLPAGPWQAVDRPDTGFYHILDSEGRLVARVDREQELAQTAAPWPALLSSATCAAGGGSPGARSGMPCAGIPHLHPHMLRHTFGTTLADCNVPIERIRELMGHASITTSQLYISVSSEHKRQAVERLDQRSGLARWWSRVRNRPYRFFARSHAAPALTNLQTVGRQAELRRLQANLDKRVDTLLTGPAGVGKSHLLSLLQGERLIRLPRLSPPRQALQEIAEVLHHQGAFQTKTGAPSLPAAGEPSLPSAAEPVQGTEGEPAPDRSAGRAPQEDFEAFKKQHHRTSIQGWARLILEAVKKDEWVLIVDDLSELSPALGRLLDQLGKKFVVLAALTQVPKRCERHFWRFERLPLDNLPSAEARQLIRQGAAGLQVADYQLLETRILQQSAGNPRAMVESLVRLRKEPQITQEVVRELVHTGARPQLDITPIVILPVVLLAGMRFLARGLGSAEAYILAGVGTAVMMGVQFVLFRMRK